jgi:ferredoxin, 2Fe-2S
MLQIQITGHSGETKSINAADNVSLMTVIRENGFNELLAICGGCRSCATCHVFVDSDHSDKLPAISKDESDLLDSTFIRQPTSRLSCQIKLSDALEGLQVTIAPMA